MIGRPSASASAALAASSPSAPVSYFDFNSPYAYLAARRIEAVFSDVPAWRPIAFPFLLRAQGRIPWSLDSRRAEGVAECERRVAERGLPPLRLPAGWPDKSYSMLPLHDPAEVATMAGVEPGLLDRGDVKGTLKGWPDEAMAAGVPGVPTVLVGNVPFWGDDHLEDAASAAAT
ncbi:MAG: hypothetical protein ACR2LY_01180 [Thermoleophilaceae bacterium]